MRRPETNESTRARNEAPRGSPSSRRTTKRTRGERKRAAASCRLTRSIARVSPFRYRTTRAPSICRVVRARARASRRRHNKRNHHRVHASRAPTGRKALEAPDRRSATFGVPREISQRRRARVRRAALSRHRSSASGAVPPSARRVDAGDAHPGCDAQKKHTIEADRGAFGLVASVIEAMPAPVGRHLRARA